jgi:hypothetical protein
MRGLLGGLAYMDTQPNPEWPRTVEDAVDELLYLLPSEQKDELQKTTYPQLSRFQHGLGTWIRNTFGLLNGNHELLAACGRDALDAAGASWVILETAWRRLRGMIPPAWDIRREGRRWTAEESRHRIYQAPEKIEYVGGIFTSERQRLTVLAMLLEILGIDKAVRLGRPEDWKAAIADLEKEKA